MNRPRALSILYFLFLGALASCSQQLNEDQAIEVNCKTSSSKWVVSSIQCNETTITANAYLEIFYQPGTEVLIRKGDKNCYSESSWTVTLSATDEAETTYVPTSGIKCYANSGQNPVTSCSSGSFSCTESATPPAVNNRYTTCAITENAMTLERFVSPSIANAGLSLCPAGQTEKITMAVGSINQQPILGPVVPTHFVINDPLDSVAGVGRSVQVEAQNASGTLAETYNDDVTLVVDGSATGDGVVDIVNGVGSLTITDTVAEVVNLTLADHAGTGLDVTSTQDLEFFPGPAVTMAFTQQPTSTSSYTSITPAMTVELYDAFANLVTHFLDTVTLSFQNDASSGNATLGGTVAVNAVAGRATFSDIAIDFAGNGYTLLASASGGPSIVSNSFNIAPSGTITVSPLSQNTDETGTQGTFTVSLNIAPLFDVTIPIASSDTSEGAVDQASLTFTNANWATPQTVTVTGQSDALIDGDIAFNIVTGNASSVDSNFHGINPDDVSLVNIDFGIGPGFTVSPLSQDTTEQGQTGTFQVSLTGRPSDDVSFSVTSSDLSEVTVDKNSLTFTTGNWSAPQMVTVTGVDDPEIDGNKDFTILTGPATSTDGTYTGLNPMDVTGTNIDDDNFGIAVTEVNSDTSEAGDSTQFSVSLISPPTNDVTLPISSSDALEGTVSVASLTFTNANWSTPQTVTISGEDDLVADGDQPYFIDIGASSSLDPKYNGLDPANIFLLNLDDDSPGFAISDITGDTIETGTNETVDVRLTSPPTHDVTINLSVSDNSEASVSPAALTFTNGNWMNEQSITLTGLNDGLQDGNQPVELQFAPATSADPTYNGLKVTNIAFQNLDDDSVGINFSPTAGLSTDESGGTTEFTIALTSAPSNNVTINLANSNATEVSLSQSSFIFTNANWMTEQRVIVTGVDDGVQDGSQLVTIITDPATSADPNYNGLDTDDILVTNFDNDTPGILVTPASTNQNRLALYEYGSQVILDVVLTSPPSDTVTLNFNSSDPSEGAPSTSSLVFGPGTWNDVQNITVTSADDAVTDGPRGWSLNFAPATSTDPSYSGMTPDSVLFTTFDDDTPEVIVSRESFGRSAVVFESGQTENFSVTLGSPPLADVTVSFTPADASEAIVPGPPLVFTTENWNVPQSATIVGPDDGLLDGNLNRNINLSTSSTDPGYNGLSIDPIEVICVDDETPDIFAYPLTSNPSDLGFTSESGETSYLDVVLTTPPLFNVQISFFSTVPSEGVLDKSDLEFTPQNWNVPQRINITGVDDATPDGDRNYRLRFNNATSADLTYQGISPPDMLLKNLDND